MITHRTRIVIRLPRDRVCSASALERATLAGGRHHAHRGRGHLPQAPGDPDALLAAGDHRGSRRGALLCRHRGGDRRPRRERAHHLRAPRAGRARGRARYRLPASPSTTFATSTPSCCSEPASAAGSPWVAASSSRTRPSSRPSSLFTERSHESSPSRRTGRDGRPDRPHLPRADPRRPRDPRGPSRRAGAPAALRLPRHARRPVRLGAADGQRGDPHRAARPRRHRLPRAQGPQRHRGRARAPRHARRVPAPGRSWRRASSSRA